MENESVFLIVMLIKSSENRKTFSFTFNIQQSELYVDYKKNDNFYMHKGPS